MTLTQSLFVFLGGGCGALARFTLSIATKSIDFPLGTLIANLLGTFLIGFFTVFGSKYLDENTRVLVITGFLGGLTTFSTFSLETFQLLDSGRYIVMASYVIANLVIGFLLLIIGRNIKF